MKTYIWGVTDQARKDKNNIFRFNAIAVMAKSLEEARALSTDLCKKEYAQDLININSNQLGGEGIKLTAKKWSKKICDKKIKFINKFEPEILEPNMAKTISHSPL